MNYAIFMDFDEFAITNGFFYLNIFIEFLRSLGS